jgi:hypothetical protein
MKTRNWSIRSKIVALVAAPMSALLVLWIFATTLTVGPASSLLAARALLDGVGRPGERLVGELQIERRLSLIQLASGTQTSALAEQRARTDHAVTEFRRRSAATEFDDVSGGLLATRVGQTLNALDGLPAGRDFIDRRVMDPTAALGLYSGMIDSAFRTFSAMIALPDEELNRQARTLTALGRARESLARTDALVSAGLAAGRFAAGEYPQLVQLIGSHRTLYDIAVSDLPDVDRAAYQRLIETADFVTLNDAEERLLTEGRSDRIPIDAPTWQRTYDSVQRQLRDFELARADALAERGVPVATGILVRLALAGVVGLLAVVLSVFIAVRVGRSLIRRLSGLRAAALEMAGERLPSVVARLRRGEEVDVAQESPALDYGSDEIGQLGQAFTEVQRSAVASAVDEATLRRGFSEVFLNIARRSQTLLHRQLAVLDRIERRVDDPEELADLFRIDHLATRMRRHAEDLVILAGATPGRGWRNPVSMIDILRGAISEVEDYARVDIMTVQPAATIGRAVGDVIHLVAELIENATSFSPPHTRVQITGQAVAHGYAVEVEDRGLGMTPEALAEANRRLADPPDFDPANSARLGLFVVAKLAARHGVQVRLRTSPYGGVTAVALIPDELVVPDDDPLALAPADGATGRTVAVMPPPTDGTRADPAAAITAPTVPTPVITARPAGTATDSATGATAGAAGSSPGRTAGPTDGPPAGAGPATDTGPAPADGALPRRTRRAGVTTRPTSAASRRPAPRPADEPAPRSPEEVRQLMSALQAGTVRGRRDAAAFGGDGSTPADSGREA